nr:MAG TPA: hypothetical protein [Caudoviricetes sp.]
MADEPTYTYDAGKLVERGKDLMRFELGDVQVQNGAHDAYLSDEEINAMLAVCPSWRKAKLALVSHVLHRFAYEVDSTSGPVSFQLDERYQHWKALYEELKLESQAAASLPLDPSSKKRPPYFFEGMHDNHDLFAPRGRRHVP